MLEKIGGVLGGTGVLGKKEKRGGQNGGCDRGKEEEWGKEVAKITRALE